MFALILSFALADDDEHRGPSPARSPTADPEYVRECGSCHVAYPAALLPARSWVAVLGGLDDHFGDVATLDAAARGRITTWLIGHAADVDPAGRRIAAGIPAGETPLRITELRWFTREHDEIPVRLVTGNPAVKTWSACSACHADAARGRFGEHDVSIPGAGRWED